MWLLVGLGNPGNKYKKNRHNIGFMAIDEMARKYDFPSFSSKFKALISQGEINGDKVVLLKPQTYMNESGMSVGEAIRFYKIPLDKVVIFHDDMDISSKKIKVKIGGGAAGHNGLKSLDAHIGKDYWRVRLGIGHPGDRSKVHNYVLSDFCKEDKKWLNELLLAICDNIKFLMQNEQGKFMNKVAQIS